MTTGMKTVGFNDAGDFFNRVSRNIRDELKHKIVKEFAEQVRSRLLWAIRSNAYDLSPLTRAYLLRKVREGHGKTALVRTGDYLKSIRVVKLRKGWSVIVRPGAKTREGESMESVAQWLEYGTKRMTARPHWRPTSEWAGQQWELYVKRRLVDSVRRAR